MTCGDFIPLIREIANMDFGLLFLLVLIVLLLLWAGWTVYMRLQTARAVRRNDLLHIGLVFVCLAAMTLDLFRRYRR